ncbi:MAG: DUF4071 domain-containing protein [Deltaproteobacteria bacterium]|nr:DUF4071 domain-containing protein [Deltaproteobacteria bacterium]
MIGQGLKSQLSRALRDVVEVGHRSGQLPELEATEKQSLADEVVDAFEKGDISAGLARLNAYAGTGRSERMLERLVDSALQTAGVDLAEASKGWSAAFAAALTRVESPDQAPVRVNPVRDLFRGVGVSMDANVERSLRRLSLDRASLSTSLDEALLAADPVKALRELEKALGPGASDLALMGLLDAYVSKESWDDVVRVFENAPESFRAYPIPQRRYALALSLTEKEAAARTVLNRLVRNDDADPATFGLLGRLHKLQADRLTKAGDNAGAAKARERAIASYREGFEADRTEIYPGINVPVLLCENGDPSSLKEAGRFAELVLTNAKRRAGTGEDDYWDAAACAEMCFLLGRDEEADQWVKTAASWPSEPWERKSTVRDLARLRAIRTAKGQDTQLIDDAMKVLAPGQTMPSAQGPSSPVFSDQKLARLMGSTYRFESSAPKWLSGNYDFDGIAHDVRMTLADLSFFTRVLVHHELDREPDVLAASSAIDNIIRARFGTLAMEDPKSAEHVAYDTRMPSIARVMGATRKDSQTNVAADWINGLGDCRQHAPVKLLLFEAWKFLQHGELLRQLDLASVASDEAKAGVITHKIERLNAFDMRILDAEILDRSNDELLELHTLTVLIERRSEALGDRMDELKAVHLADPFYQQRIPLGYGEVEVADTNGELRLRVKKPLPDGRKVDLRPAPYSFDRAKRAVDYGQLRFRGVEVASPGWERDIPVDGVNLAALHAYADKVAAPKAPVTS